MHSQIKTRNDINLQKSSKICTNLLFGQQKEFTLHLNYFHRKYNKMCGIAAAAS